MDLAGAGRFARSVAAHFQAASVSGGSAAAGRAGGRVNKLMRNHERDRLNRLERRCDWLMARIAIGESKGRDMSFDIAEHSALRWLIDEFGRQHVDLLAENRSLRQEINIQRNAIRRLLARLQPGTLSDNELEALVDLTVTSPATATQTDRTAHAQDTEQPKAE